MSQPTIDIVWVVSPQPLGQNTCILHWWNCLIEEKSVPRSRDNLQLQTVAEKKIKISATTCKG